MLHRHSHHDQQCRRSDAAHARQKVRQQLSAVTGGLCRQQSAHQEDHRHHRQGHRGQGWHKKSSHNIADDQQQRTGENFYRFAQIGFVGQGFHRRSSGVFAFIGHVFGIDRRLFGVSLDLSGITIQIQIQNAVTDRKNHQTKADARKGRQSRQFLCHAQGEGIHGGRGKAKACRKGAHAQTGQGIPAQRTGQQNHDGHQRHQFFKYTEHRAEQHEKQHQHRHQAVFFCFKPAHQTVHDILQHSALVQQREHAADDADEHNDGDDGHRILAPQHLKGRCKPPPEGIAALPGKGKGARLDDLLAVNEDAPEAAAGNDPCERACAQHEHQQNDHRGKEGFLADFQTGIVVHITVSISKYWKLFLLIVPYSRRFVKTVKAAFPHIAFTL